jgi:thioesterase domain-containing protein
MKTRMFKGVCLVTVGAIVASASVGTLRAQFPYVPSLPFGGGRHDAARHLVRAAVVASVIYFVAKHQASEEQRRLAEERARRSYARMSAKRKADMKAKKVRYIAVDTRRSAKSSPKAKKTVMIYDTQTQRIASNNAYDVAQTPSVGSTAKIDTYSAEYVGSGL